MVSALDSGSSGPGARFSKVPKSFRTRKALSNLKPYDYRAALFKYS